MNKNKIFMVVTPKTIYTDLVILPDIILLGVTIHYYNYSDNGLYMKIFGNGTNWSSNSQALGLLNSGANAYNNLDNFMSRSKPASETTEQITLTLKGYSDSGYTNEVYSYSRNVTVIMIKSDDGSWTTDMLNNFDDGTVQGWSIGDGNGGIGVASDFVLSVPYSLYRTVDTLSIPPRFRMLYVYFNNLILMQLGNAVAGSDNIPINKWIRIVLPLTSNITANLKYLFYNNVGMNAISIQKSITTPNRTTVYAIMNIRCLKISTVAHIRFDDFMVISK